MDKTIDENKKTLLIACCTNCGKKGHFYKYCNEPITSYGIILVKYDRNIISNSDSDMIKISKFMNNIQFLMISRKNSLGYIDFIRGKYKPDNQDNLRYLIQQMSPDEIVKIKNETFDTLWNDFWMDKNNRKYVQEEYKIAYEKYNKISKDLPKLIDETKLLYLTPEWGFPKGRRNNCETSLECAIREFKEETGYSESDISLIDNIKPFIENFIGTNGVKYRHIYFLAECITDKEPEISNDTQKYEIGNIGFMNYNDTIEIIREYHVAKKNIVKHVLIYFLNQILPN